MEKAATFLLDTKLLAEAIHMPINHEIFGVEWDFHTNSIRVFVAGPDLPVVAPGCKLREIRPIITREEDVVTWQRTYSWDWGTDP